MPYLIAKGGRGFVGVSACAAIIAFLISPYVAFALSMLTVFLVFVFRDPNRTVGDGIVSPADGTVREVNHEKGLVSIYLALRNVHVTRSPIGGVVEKTVRTSGKHAPAFSKRIEKNERVDVSLGTAIGTVSIVQMTGAIARRIVPYIREGQLLCKGQKIGLIRFGSRVDLHLPPHTTRILAKKSQKLRAGVTRIAEALNDDME